MELYSVTLFSFQKKIEELGVFEEYARLEESLLDPNVARRSSPSIAQEDVSRFIRRSILACPVFLQTYRSLFPSASDMLSVICSDLPEHDYLSKVVCDFIATYHCSSAADMLTSPSAVFEGIAQRCHDRGLEYDALAVENVLFPFILSICLERSARVDEDARFNAQCKQLKKATQSHFSIRLDLQCRETTSEPWEDAIRELQSLRFYYCPTEMLGCIARVAKAIYIQAQKNSGTNEAIGGDDFMDIVCFVVFRARLKAMCSLVKFVETFMSADAEPEHQYYFTCVQLALSFILDLNWSKLSLAANQIKQATRNPSKRMPTILVPEKSAFVKRFVETPRPLFQVIAASMPLNGYVLYCVREYFDGNYKRSSSASSYFQSFRRTVAVHTGLATDKIVVCAVRMIADSDNPASQGDFFQPAAELPDLRVVDSRFGSIQCIERLGDAPDRLSFGEALLGIRVPGGNYDDVAQEVTDFCVARQLLWPQMEDLFELHLDEVWTLALCHQYCVDDDTPWEAKRSVGRSIVREAQIMLKLLACYPRLAPLDGSLGSKTVFAIQTFQEEFKPTLYPLPDSARDYSNFERRSMSRALFLQSSLEDNDELPATGRLNPATMTAMYRTLLYQALRLNAPLPSDLVLDLAQVSSAIKAFQEKHHLYPSGSFDDITLEKLLT